MTSKKRTRTSVHVTIPADKDRIREGEFISRTDINSVDVSPNVRQIMKGAFKDCSYLRTVRFTKPSLLQVIHEEAFAGCNNLRSINIPSTVRLIKKSAFKRCGALESIVFEPKPPTLTAKHFLTIEQSAFDRQVGSKWVPIISGWNPVLVPARAVKIGPYAFRGWPEVTFEYNLDFHKEAFDGFDRIQNALRKRDYHATITIKMDNERFLGTIQVRRKGFKDKMLYITARKYITQGQEDSWIVYKRQIRGRPMVFRDILSNQKQKAVIDQAPPGLGAIQSPKRTPTNRQGYNWHIETINAGNMFQRITTETKLWRDMTFFTMGKLQPHFLRELLDSKGLGKDPLTNPHFVFTLRSKVPIQILRINVRRRDVLKAQFPTADLFEKQLEEICKLKNCRGWVGFSPGDNRYVLPNPKFPRPKMLIHNIQWECALSNVPPLVNSFDIVSKVPYDDVVKSWIARGKVRPQRWIPLVMKDGPTLKF